VKTIILATAVLSLATVAIAQGQAVVSPAGRPGKILEEAECTAVWKEAGGADLTAEQAKARVTNFEQVDKDNDGKITNAEFTEGCKAGWIQKGTAPNTSAPK
jgi:hypothetical protein